MSFLSPLVPPLLLSPCFLPTCLLFTFPCISLTLSRCAHQPRPHQDQLTLDPATFVFSWLARRRWTLCRGSGAHHSRTRHPQRQGRAVPRALTRLPCEHARARPRHGAYCAFVTRGRGGLPPSLACCLFATFTSLLLATAPEQLQWPARPIALLNGCWCLSPCIPLAWSNVRLPC